MQLKRLPRRLRHGEEATLVEQLGELRARIFIALGAVAVGFVVAFAFHEHIIEWLIQPLPPDKRNQLVVLGVAEAFFTAVKISFYTALAAALPVVLYQLWSFLAPAFEEHAQRVVAISVAIATGLFVGGLSFGYWIVLPRALEFLTSFDEELYNEQLRASYYYSFAVGILVALALVFELPVFILTLVRLGLLTSDRLRRNRRVGIVIVVAVAVLLPTVDPVTLVFEAAPLILLFEASIWASVFFERRWEREGVLWATAD